MGSDCGTCGVAGEWQCLNCPAKADLPAMWFAEQPRCPVHGQMHPLDPGPEPGPPTMEGVLAALGGWRPACAWVCHGFDGEGCPHRVGAADLDWHPLGVAETAEFPLDRYVAATPHWVAENVRRG